MKKSPPLVLLLTPGHTASPWFYVKEAAAIHGIKNPVAREIEPRAGCRRFEITEKE